MGREISFFGYLEQEIARGRQQSDDLPESLVELIAWVPDFMGLLMRVTMDNRLRKDQRLFAASALVYLISPEDFMPERSLGLRGLVEDSVLVARTISLLLTGGAAPYLQEQWRGNASLDSTISDVIAQASSVLDESVTASIELYIKTNRSFETE